MDEGLNLVVTARFWNNTEKVFVQRIRSTHGNQALNFFDERLLTYQVQVTNDSGEVLETWEHHFWTKLIDVDRMSSSVSSQPIQGSVIETP